MKVYLLPHPDYGFMAYPDLDCLLDNIRLEIESHDLDPVPGKIVIEITTTMMTEEELAALPDTD